MMTVSSSTHFMSPLLGVKALPQKGGFAVYAHEFVPAGSLLVVWGGDIVTAEQFARLTTRQQMHSIQVDEFLYQVPHREPEAGDYINHSCNPNAGLDGPISLVALRDIQPGEEICFDYAMSDGSPYDEFDCQCGAADCRGRVTGEDWQRLELQQRYAGHFSPYLQRRIARQQAQRQLNGLARPINLVAVPT